MKDDQVYLLHIRDCATRIMEYTQAGRAAFLRDSKTQDAVIRNLEIIGEAVKNLSEECRQRSPQIPWRRIAGLRDVLIHAYFGVKPETVWNVVERELPVLQGAVAQLLGPTGT